MQTASAAVPQSVPEFLLGCIPRDEKAWFQNPGLDAAPALKRSQVEFAIVCHSWPDNPMLERYSHVRMEAKRSAMEALAVSTKTAGYDTTHDTNVVTVGTRPV